MLNVTDSDLGRPIDHFSHNTSCDNLYARLRATAHDGKVREFAAATKSGKDLFTRILPYRTEQDEAHGVIPTFIDVALFEHAARIVQADLGRKLDVESEL